jgi:hypothetical protein
MKLLGKDIQKFKKLPEDRSINLHKIESSTPCPVAFGYAARFSRSPVIAGK